MVAKSGKGATSTAPDPLDRLRTRAYATFLSSDLRDSEIEAMAVAFLAYVPSLRGALPLLKDPRLYDPTVGLLNAHSDLKVLTDFDAGSRLRPYSPSVRSWSTPSSAPFPKERKTRSLKTRPCALGVNYSAGASTRRSDGRTAGSGALGVRL
jgi:hypothetical protein